MKFPSKTLTAFFVTTATTSPFFSSSSSSFAPRQASALAPNLSTATKHHHQQQQQLKMSTTADSSSSSSRTTNVLSSIVLDNTWPRELSTETPHNLKKSRMIENLSLTDDDNRTKRQVFNGHWVQVKPTGLKNPKLILIADDVAYNVLNLTKEQVESNDFVNFVSGNIVLEESWATPYALSIMGTRYTTNCPFGNGNGYGDGRAISIAEFNGHELQLKGAGKTPFHRGADGRAVLRSSIREFLASEAMHHLGVSTTRALSLIRSTSKDGISADYVNRPWYTSDAVLQIPEMDDIRLANYEPEQRKQIIDQLRTTRKADPNIMIQEPCAITCRVATSFTRIGHFDLFARRVERASLEMANKLKKGADENGKELTESEIRFNRSTVEWKELEELIWHACKREYKSEAYDPYIATKDIASAAEKLLELSANDIATMVSHWIRVGFAQGNFNADNCLVAGRTMDYGPFGFMEEYTPLFAKWTGSGQHFGFLNQPSAGFANYQVLVESIAPVIASYRNLDTTDDIVDKYLSMGQTLFPKKLDEVINVKMGLPVDAEVGNDLWDTLQPLLRKSRTDWTLFWRQLTYVLRDGTNFGLQTNDWTSMENIDYDKAMQILEDAGEGHNSTSSPFYEPLTPEVRREYIEWIKDWLMILKSSHGTQKTPQDVYESMRNTNPKYVLREWMLVDAYTAAAAAGSSGDDDDEEGDYTVLNELYQLIQHPYDEGTTDEIEKYYRRTPTTSEAKGGTAFMS